MEAKRFDAVARTLPRATPRRTMLGAAFVALFGVAAADDAVARKRRRNKKRRKKCRGGRAKCGKKCRDIRNDSNNCGSCGNVCPTGDCLNGTCTCLSDADCAGCACAPRKGGGFACLAEIDLDTDCTSDAQCPELGSFCTDSDHCTISCKE